eukprot:CAMPEP_0196821474 /NCGR_PEP_ID=MMETSP1362-20130617/79351_1 /TAXON_ID=163516 /ORGANISM="Leptocylindrus danicus, Strain CCMP1856" /LENGTH=102 /DNA_ID=CAMNT_0042200667 /DNA_START=458 /DNA_END=766 /DNA_ORIENTATION=-
MMNVVSSAIKATIVCMAEMPDELERNHPHLFRHMRNAWLTELLPNSGLHSNIIPWPTIPIAFRVGSNPLTGVSVEGDLQEPEVVHANVDRGSRAREGYTQIP